jgi:CBS domain containing-hemolysin-like protein
MIATLMENPRSLLVTILILNVFANILVQNTVSSLFGNFSGWIVKVGTPLLLTLIFGEVIPKSLALPNNVRISRFVVFYITWLKKILFPIRQPLTTITSYISRVLFFFLKKEKPIKTEELEHILSTSKEKGVLSTDEVDLISGYLDLKDSLVKERMTQHRDVIFYDINEPIEKLLDLFVDKELTRIPVCNGELEDIIGIISVKTFFLYQKKIGVIKDLKKYLKKPFFIPETTKAWNLLNQLREKRESLAVVVDEYGSINGLITQEDLIESVTGDIEDVRDKKHFYTRSGKDIIIASGKMTLEEFETVFDEKLTSISNVLTIGGWIIEKLGNIPQAGEKLIFEGFLFYILASDPNRIKRIYIRRNKETKKGRKKR